jgi:hypothetical protein
MLDPFGKKSRVLSRFFDGGGPNPLPRSRFQIGNARGRPRTMPSPSSARNPEGHENFLETLRFQPFPRLHLVRGL